MRVRIVALVVTASVCTAVVSLTGGPARFLAGLVLALVIPSCLAFLALAPGPVRVVLAVPLGLAACAVAGAVVAVVKPGFDPAMSALALLLACVVLAVAALIRPPRLSLRKVTLPRTALLCAVPVLVLTGFAVWRIAALAREPGPAYTEFAAETATSIEVRSHERATRRFRLETSVDGQVGETAEFDLRPGETARFVVARGRDVRARLFVAGQTAPYRELTL
jgi:hypothetical protein